MKIKTFTEKNQLSTENVHNNPLLNRIFQNRDIHTSKELNYGLGNLLPPDMFKDMDKATDLLITHILADSKIIIIGDYDCDGATATTIAVEGLKMLGAKNVDFLIPDRVKHGYGLSPAIVEIASKSSPDLIVTVDNGISAFDGALAVSKLKKTCQLLITDHHLPSETGEVPQADAIINPSQPGCNFPSKNIAGCGVIFYVIAGLRKKMREKEIFEKLKLKEPQLLSLLDVLALGTIADVVKLDYNNRNIVSAGLSWINKGMCRPGLEKLLMLSKKTIGNIVSDDFGFAVGPRINAAGRLDDMSIGIKCLLEKDKIMAEAYAQQLNELNDARKEIEHSMLDTALQSLDKINKNADSVILYNPKWHEGVVGILASRIKDKFDRPTICFSDTHELADSKMLYENEKRNGLSKEKLKEMKEQLENFDIKGSARSINGIHLKHILDGISEQNPSLLSKFGGHAMAAGLSIKFKDLEKFKIVFEEKIKTQMTDNMRKGGILVDIKDIPTELMTMENAEILESQKIWGQGFEKPIFSQTFNIVSKRQLGDKHLKLVVKVKNSDKQFDAIAFNCIDRGVEPVNENMEASFRLSINEFRGRKSLQLMIDHLQDPDLVYSLEMAEKEKNRPLEMDGVIKSQKKIISNESELVF